MVIQLNVLLSHIINYLEPGSWQFLPLPDKIVIPKSPSSYPNLAPPATFFFFLHLIRMHLNLDMSLPFVYFPFMLLLDRIVLG